MRFSVVVSGFEDYYYFFLVIDLNTSLDQKATTIWELANAPTMKKVEIKFSKVIFILFITKLCLKSALLY